MSAKQTVGRFLGQAVVFTEGRLTLSGARWLPWGGRWLHYYP
jgi:hypothetical protein